MGGECLFGSVLVHGEVLDKSNLTCVVPAGVEGRVVSVAVKSSDQGVHSHAGRPYRYLPPVKMAAVWPTRGSKSGGTLVSVTGSGFEVQAGLTCRFGVVGVRDDGLKVLTSSLVTCLSPVAGDLGTVELAVVDRLGADASSGIEFLYEESATVSSVRPSWSAQGGQGQVVTVSGSHFVQSGALSCRFGMAAAAPGKFLSSSLVVCRAPARGSGRVNVAVSNNGADGSTGSVLFTYTQQVSAVSAMPSRGPVSGGTTVTVAGSLQVGSNAILYCMFGMSSVIATRLDGDGGVTCAAPASADA